MVQKEIKVPVHVPQIALKSSNRVGIGTELSLRYQIYSGYPEQLISESLYCYICF